MNKNTHNSKAEIIVFTCVFSAVSEIVKLSIDATSIFSGCSCMSSSNFSFTASNKEYVIDIPRNCVPCSITKSLILSFTEGVLFKGNNQNMEKESKLNTHTCLL